MVRLLSHKSCGNGTDRELIPAFDNVPILSRRMINQAVRSWLLKTPSIHTRVNYRRDLEQFLNFEGIEVTELLQLTRVHPDEVAAWRDWMRARGYSNATIRRKMTALRSLFSYLQVYGYIGANPAHGKFVSAPAVPRDGKTVGLSPKVCRQLLYSPDSSSPVAAIADHLDVLVNNAGIYPDEGLTILTLPRDRLTPFNPV
jgi:site-specific recombinase XerC